MMNIYNFPLWVIKPLSLIGKRFPKQVIDWRYYRQNKCWIDWEHPRNIHEYSIVQYFKPDTNLKLFGQLADKVGVRDFVRERIGEQYLTKLYGVYHSVPEIDFNVLPDRFVLKTNNGCGNNVIVRDKRLMDQKEVRKRLQRWLQFPYGDLTGQIHYSLIKPLILAEEYLEQVKGKDMLPYDYKFFCYKGKPLYILYYEGRRLNGHFTPNMLYDMNWNPIADAVKRPIDHPVDIPVSFEEMKRCVANLCFGFDFVRVDFYEVNNRPVFGEMTFTPDISLYINKDFYPLMDLYKNGML